MFQEKAVHEKVVLDEVELAPVELGRVELGPGGAVAALLRIRREAGGD